MAISIQALFSIPKLGWELAIGGTRSISIIVGIATASLAVFLTWRYCGWLSRQFQYVTQTFAIIPRRRWIVICISAGVIFRIFWVIAFPAPLRSDYATYFGLARNLVEKGSY